MTKSLVTSLFELGGDFSSYREHYTQLAKLDIEMFVFTEHTLIDTAATAREQRATTIYEFNIDNEADDLKELIEIAQATPTYIKLIGPNLYKQQKYRTPHQIKASLLIPTMVCMASIQATTSQLVYVDARQDINFVRSILSTEFDEQHIHLFGIRDYTSDITIHDIIAGNLQFINGGIIVATKDLWRRLEFLILEGARELLDNYLIDDINLMLLLATLAEPEIFTIHKT